MNPNQFIQQIISNSQIMQNPMIANAYQLLQRDDENGLRQLANNVCKEKGLDINNLVQKTKSKFGM